MSVDNRTELNDCDNATGFVGDGQTPGTSTLTGQRYEGTASIFTQHSNVDEQMHTTQTSGGGGTFSLDLSDSTLYLLVKDNLVSTFALGGVQFVIGDGTDLIGYDVGGNDAVGLTLAPFFNTYKLDVSIIVTTPGSFNAYTGTEAGLAQTTITQFGYGSLHLAKAQGNVSNVFVDRMTHIANGSYALTINGGTVGTPETMVDVQGDDVTNGWGVISNPLGAQFVFFAPTEWGNSAATADVFFTADDEQWFWVGDNAGGHTIGAANFPMRIVGNATDTIDVKWTNLVIVNTGTRAEFLAGNTDTNVMQFDNVTFTDIGTITFTTQSAGSRFCDNSTFNNCDQVAFSSIDADGCTFNGTIDANGAVLWSTTAADVANQDNFTYNSDGTGHGIEISLNTASLTTYNISGYTVSGYDGTGAGPGGGSTGNELFLIDNLLDGDVTINVTGGTGTFNDFQKAAGYTGTVTINQTVTLTLTGIETDSEVRIINLDNVVDFNRELTGSEQISGGVTKATLADAGTGYVATNVLTITGGTGTAATITVDTVDGGGEILTFTVTTPGTYTANPPTPASVTGGAGSGATFRLDISGTFDFTYDAGLGVNIAIIVFHLNFKDVRIEQVIPGVSSSIPIQQSVDRTFNNP